MQMIGLQGSPLSTQQARLWAWQKKCPVYRTLCAVQIQGIMQRDGLKTAVRRIVERHEILRTVFYTLPGMDIPMQVIGDNTLWSWAEISLEYLDGSHQWKKIDELFTALQNEICDLQHGPLLYIWLFHLAANRHVLVVSLPALCADSSSIKLFIDELGRAYTQDALAEEVLQYADVSAWQENVLLKDEAELERRYWHKIDLMQMTTMRLPFERKGHASEKKRVNDAFAPRVVKIPLQDGLAQQIEMQARQYGVSHSSWLLTCWQVLLWRLSGESRFLVGVECDGRTYEELTHALGLYTRFVPVSAYFEEDRPFVHMLASVNMSLQEVTKRQMYFTWQEIQKQMGSDAPPLFFPVSFEYDTWPGIFDAEALTFLLVKRWSCTEPFVLKLSILYIGEHLQLELHYDSQSISSKQVHHLVTLLQTLMQNVVVHPHLPVGSLPILEPTEQTQLLIMSNGPHAPVSAQGLHRLFEAQVKRTPSQLAVISARERLTYQQLNRRANRLAQVLYRRGVGPNVLVGLYMRRGAQMLVGLLGILKAGGAYVPLDPESPPARLILQLQQSQALFLLSEQRMSPRLPEWEERTLWLEDLEQEMAEATVGNLPSGSQGEDLAYVIYTSGSTGGPKGVMIRQESIVNYTLALCQLLGAEPGWQYATVSTLAADLGNTAIFCALASGGCVQVLDYETVTSSQEMARWIERYPIDVLKIVPSHLSALLAGERAKELVPRQALVLGGEEMPPSLLERLQELGGNCQVYNHYGPTETTIGVLVNPLGRLGAREEIGTTVPLGKPITNTEVYILDRWMQVVPEEVTGELYVGGTGVAMGYLGQAEQTAERFVPHPWSRQTGARLYRTGDLARYNEQGQIEFVGRRDRQVKLRGYRIELAEIQAVLSRHPQIRNSVVVLREDVPAEPRLVSYVVARQRLSLPPEQLREFLRQSLPEYMVPVVYVQLDALPLTANGKLDWQNLPVPEQRPHKEQGVVAGPRSPIEEMLLETWRDLLGLPELGIHDHFFLVGGHSLLAMRVMAQIQAILHVALPVQMLFEAPTVAGLAQRVEQALRQNEGMQEPPLVAMERPEAIPLSFAQQRLWFLDQLEPESTAYLCARARRFLGQLNAQALEQGLQEVICRHESLRTTFEIQSGQVVQVIQSARHYTLPVIDLQRLRQEHREGEVRQLARQEAQHPCDLEKGPLLRMYVVRLASQEHVVLLTLHHIVTDGWSNEVLLRDLLTVYQAKVSGQPSQLAPLSIQYADYSLWQRQWLQGEVLQAQLAYWKKQLVHVTPLALPTDYPRLPGQTYRGAIQSQTLPVALYENLVLLSQQENVTMFMLLLAAFQVLLLRYTGQTDISVGVPIANRTRAEIAGVIGFFVNTLVLRANLSGNPTFLEGLRQVCEVCLEAYAHQDMPFEKLVEVLQPERGMSRSPFFQVSFQLAHEIAPSQLLSGLSLEPLKYDGASADDDLRIMMTETQQGFSCTAFYNTNLFEAQTIDRFLEHFQTLLQGIVAVPETPIALLPLLSEQERHILILKWNETQTDYPQDQCVHQLFEQQVERTPDTVALVFEDQTLSYAQLNRRANQLAKSLQDLGVGPEVLVGICLERSLEMIVGLLGVLKAGGAYVPLDPTYPAERLAFMVADAHISVILGLQKEQDILSSASTTVVNLEQIWSLPDLQPERISESSVHAENFAYMIYTSGSTGSPKGVVVSHASLCNLVNWHQQTYHVTHMDRATHVASLAFDAAVWEIWPYLLAGSCLLLVDEEHRSSPSQLIDWITRRAVTLAFLPTPLAEQVVQGPWPTERTLRALLTGGDKLHRLPITGLPCQLINHYGPTENTVVTTCASVIPEMAIDPSIGRPIANIEVYILDQQMHLVPIGVRGELYIGGIGLARGYLNRPELTAERFVPHPWSLEPGARLYRTGDLVRYRCCGDIEYLGRLDQQVKLRGYRIELGEIEAVLGQHPAIQACIVLAREDELGEKRLVAYAVLKQIHTATMGDLRTYLQDRLPAYMIPSAFVLLDAIPLTPNGKVDRRALPVPQERQDGEHAAQEGARTPIEELLVGVWSEVLGYRQVGIHDHFFESGGHSLLATQLVARMRAMLGVEIPVRAIFEVPTVAGLARRIEQKLHKNEGIEVPPLVPVERPEGIPLSFAQQRLWFLDQLEPGNTTYLSSGALRFRGVLNAEALERSLQELVRRHEILRTTFTIRAGQPMQIIHPAGRYCLPLIDLGRLKPEEREKVTRHLAGQEVCHPCDLEKGPLLRTYLLRLAAQEHVVFLTLHHIITDGWSNEVLARELTALYRAFISGQPSLLAPLPIQYADYALWQRQWLQGEVLQKDIDYWLHQLEGASALELPTDIPRTAVQSDRGARYSFVLPTELSAQLVSFSRQEGVTLFMTLLAVFQVLLYRLTGQTDIVVGTDVANRTHVETERLIGFFVNLLALRTDIQRSSSFRHLLQYVRAMVLGAYAHQELPFDLVVEHLEVERNGKQTPLVQVLFVLQNIPEIAVSLPSIELETMGSASTSAKFDLALFLQEGSDGIRGSVVYRRDLFEEQTIVTWMHRLETVLRNVVVKPDTSIDDLEISTDEEKTEQTSTEKELYKIGSAIWRRKKRQALDLSEFHSSLMRQDNE